MESKALSIFTKKKKRNAKKQRKRFPQSNKTPLVVVGLCSVSSATLVISIEYAQEIEFNS
jgi:hypothetical protein